VEFIGDAAADRRDQVSPDRRADVVDPSIVPVPLCSVDSLLTDGTVVARGYGTVMEDFLVHHASVAGDRQRGRLSGECTLD
jgi:hypothetical protein